MLTMTFMVTVEFTNTGNHSDRGKMNRDRKKLRERIQNDLGDVCYNSNQPFANDSYKVKGTRVKHVKAKAPVNRPDQG